MFELPLRNTRLCFHFSFFAAVSVLSLFSFNGLAAWGLYSCLIHECGHLFSMTVAGKKAQSVVFYGAGIKIVGADGGFTPFFSELFILFAGCAVNIAVFAATCLPVFARNGSAELFGTLNCVIAAFNLLPLSCLDGGKILALFIHKFCDYNRAVLLEKYLKGLNVALTLVIIAAFAFCGRGNFTLFLTLLYLLFSELTL